MKHLKRHPSEVPITMDQWAEVAYMADMIDRLEAETGAQVVGALAGSRL